MNENLRDLIEFYKKRANEYRLQAELSEYFEDNDIEQFELKADENDLLAILLESFNAFLDYDSLTMCHTIDNIKVIQITELHIPIENSVSIITIYDLDSEEEIDSIELMKPLNKQEFEYFAKQYVDRL